VTSQTLWPRVADRQRGFRRPARRPRHLCTRTSFPPATAWNRYPRPLPR